MSSEKFESLEDDICTLLDELKVSFERKIPNCFGGTMKERDFEEVFRLIDTSLVVCSRLCLVRLFTVYSVDVL